MDEERTEAVQNEEETVSAEEPVKEKKSRKKKDEALLQKIEELEKEVADSKDKALRQMAEFDNFRKRTQREKLELYDDATGKCIEKLLSVIDNFERALATPCDGNEDFKKGIEMIFEQLMQTLKGMGVEEIESEGKPFDPEFHNAVSSIEDDAYGENTVCQVYQKGFTYKGKVIRHAMVVVANS